MKAWIHKVRCWFDDRAHMILWSLAITMEGVDVSPAAIPLQNMFPKWGQYVYYSAMFGLYLLGLWRSHVTHARGKEMKAEVHELRVQVAQKDPNGSV